MAEHNYQVGDTVYVVPGRGFGRPCDATVTKIARKWAYLDIHKFGRAAVRFNPKSGCVDGRGYSSPGQVYPSQKVYDDHIARQEKWWGLCAMMRERVSPPDHLSADDINEIALKLVPPLPQTEGDT